MPAAFMRRAVSTMARRRSKSVTLASVEDARDATFAQEVVALPVAKRQKSLCPVQVVEHARLPCRHVDGDMPFQAMARALDFDRLSGQSHVVGRAGVVRFGGNAHEENLALV